MGLEYRNGHAYYYKKERDGDQVRSVYVARGAVAYHLQGMDVVIAYVEGEKRQRQAAARAEVEALDPVFDDLEATLRQLVRDHLQAYGYHQHKGQWRKRRGTKASSTAD